MASGGGARSHHRPKRPLGRGALGLAICGIAAASPYNEREALRYAYISTAAYCGAGRTNVSALERWDCGPPCQNAPGLRKVRQIMPPAGFDAYAIIGKHTGFFDWHRGLCVLGFRGTSDLMGWVSDLESLELVELPQYGINCTFRGKNCKVGDGFIKNYLAIAEYIRGNLSAIGCGPGSRLTVTGHSLGAAEAVLAMYDLHTRGYKIQTSYTYGQPRVGDATFVSAFEKDIGPDTCYRVSYRRDPIVHLFWLGYGFSGRFRHISREVFYSGNVSQGYRICDGSGEDPKCSAQFQNTWGLLYACLNLNNCDHLHYMTAEKKVPMDSSSCTNGTRGGAGSMLLV
mmetsp:Transcript_103140/g.274210  ORF Transcript_103140/g.274210 Transcript_103140/m.274210 type:complete len:342 (-) Transcript_103140:98-1123(-)